MPALNRWSEVFSDTVAAAMSDRLVHRTNRLKNHHLCRIPTATTTEGSSQPTAWVDHGVRTAHAMRAQPAGPRTDADAVRPKKH